RTPPTGRGFKTQTGIPKQVRDDKDRNKFKMTETLKSNPVVMLNSFQHLWPDARAGLFEHLICFLECEPLSLLY
ncbi:MAG TPA: hypothetical protein VGB16_06580, partial [candidate division Zixibacteria bacterium]